jgi:hypothetical protein
MHTSQPLTCEKVPAIGIHSGHLGISIYSDDQAVSRVVVISFCGNKWCFFPYETASLTIDNQPTRLDNRDIKNDFENATNAGACTGSGSAGLA